MNELGGIDLAIIASFLLLILGVGVALSKMASQGLDDYFLGGKKIPWWILGISTSSSNFDMAGTMIIVAVVFGLGYRGFLVEIRGGVGLSLALLLVFLAKWLRRSRVMTSAEWMKLRFGTDKQGRAAHLLSAIANIVLSLGMIVYFSKGAGKFLTHFLPFNELTCTTVMVAVGLTYTLMSGLYGVVFTDVIQMILMAFTALFITVEAFTLTSEVVLPAGFLDLSLSSPAALGGALAAKDPAGWESIFSMFSVCVFLWVARTTLEGLGGVGGYTDQRFFAARTEREASLLTLEAIILSAFRWTMVAGLVVMGFHLVQNGGEGADLIMGDAENVLPVVLGNSLPIGVRGLVIAGLIAAAMSTFDSTLNAGASLIVRDVYQTYLRPDASSRDLMRMSRYATLALCIGGVALASVVPNINQIWGFITMGLGAGLFVPLVLRWYWPRFTGYGFAAGTAGGFVAAVIANTVLGLPLYYSFPTIVLSAFAVCVIASLLTPAAPMETLIRFYLQINPWGLWSKVGDEAEARGMISKEDRGKRAFERVIDGISVCFSVPFQLSLLIASMAFVFHDWKKFAFFSIATLISAVGLRYFWYQNLKTTEECEAEDKLYESNLA